MSLRKQTISGVRWNFFGRIASQAFQFVSVVILARILTPEDFGLVGMTIVFTGFVRLFRDAGFGSALIQKTLVEERHLSSVFYANVVLGIALTALVAGLAPLIAAFFDEPRLVAITQVIALDFVIGSVTIVQMAQLKRALKFKTVTLIDMFSRAAGGIVAIGMALLGYGVWSLVLQGLASSVVFTVSAWTVCEWRPKRLFTMTAIRDLLHYSTNLLVFNVINYWTRNADNLLIGKLVGSAGLGIYSRAYGLMTFPVRQFANVIGQVMFPVLSRFQDDIPRIKATYLKANRLIALLTVPLMLGLLATTESVILLLLGPQWVDVIPVLQVLCLMGVKQPIGASMGWLLTALGRTDTLRKWAIYSGSVNLVAVAIGVQWGVMGVAIAYVVFGYVIHYHSVVIPSRLVDVSFKEWHTNLTGVFACSILMTVCVVLVKLILPHSWPDWLFLAVQVPIGCASYWALLHAFKVRAYREMIDLMPELTRRAATSTVSPTNGASG